MLNQKSKHLLIFILSSFYIFTLSAQKASSLDSTIYLVAAVDEKPRLEGKSDTFLFKFIATQIKLPMSVRNTIGTTGTCYTYFVIDEKGQLDNQSIKLLAFVTGATLQEPIPKRITDEKLLNSTQLDCLTETKRVIRLMKKWKAAKVNGQNVKCSMTLPITFKNEGLMSR